MTEKRIIDTEEGLKEYYEREADLVGYAKLDERSYQLELRRTEIIMDLLGLHSATSLLDIGCGEGLQLESVHRKFPHVGLSGMDVSEKRIERARERVPSANLVARSATGEGLGFGRGNFDRAICSEVLEHLPRPEKALTNAYEALRPSGLLAVSVPYAQKLVRVICMHCGKLTSDGHINSFDEGKMTSMLQNVGFTVISARGYKMIWLPFVERKLPYAWWRHLERPLGWHYRPYSLIALARK